MESSKDKNQKKVFQETQRVVKISGRIAKIYYDGKNIFADADQYFAHHQRLAPKTNPGMKAADGWLHALGVPLEYVEALFEYVPQIFGLLVFGIAPHISTGCAIHCIWTRRCRILYCCKDTESVQTSNCRTKSQTKK
jgi:hypothetical protein